MNCNFVATGETLPKLGRLWSCANVNPSTGEACGLRCVGDRPAENDVCLAGDVPRPPPTMFYELPCARRVDEHDEHLAACCGGSIPVEFAACHRGRCSMRGVDGSTACIGCNDRR